MTLTLDTDELQALTGYLRPADWLDAHWKRCVARPDDLPMTPYELNAGPDEPGIYFLWNAGDRLLYVGKSTYVARRLVSHWRARRIRFACFSVMELPSELLGHVEAAHIEALAPPYNCKPERVLWRGHATMVRRIRRAWAAYRT